MSKDARKMLAALVLGITIPVVGFAGLMGAIFGIDVAVATFGLVAVLLAATWVCLWVWAVVWAVRQVQH